MSHASLLGYVRSTTAKFVQMRLSVYLLSSTIPSNGSSATSATWPQQQVMGGRQAGVHIAAELYAKPCASPSATYIKSHGPYGSWTGLHTCYMTLTFCLRKMEMQASPASRPL